MILASMVWRPVCRVLHARDDCGRRVVIRLGIAFDAGETTEGYSVWGPSQALHLC